MKVLVVGKGGREHALVWKLAQSPRIEKLYAAPGNPGMESLANLVPIRVDKPASEREQLSAEIAKLADWALAEGIDLTIVGPDDALAGGIVDHFQQRGLKIFGPTEAAARLESSKAFSKDLMQRIGVPKEVGVADLGRRACNRGSWRHRCCARRARGGSGGARGALGAFRGAARVRL